MVTAFLDLMTWVTQAGFAGIVVWLLYERHIRQDQYRDDQRLLMEVVEKNTASNQQLCDLVREHKEAFQDFQHELRLERRTLHNRRTEE